MSRSREFEPEDVLQIAIDLFWETGYRDGSVDEVVRRSGVAKYGIYGTFGSKDELFMKVLHQYALDRHRDIQSPIRRPDASLPAIRRFFKRAVGMMTRDEARRGCLIVNSGVELGSRNAEVRDFVRRFFEETKHVMEGCLQRAVERGEIAPTVDVSTLATYLVTEFRTALMLAASGSKAQQIRAHLDLALRVLR